MELGVMLLDVEQQCPPDFRCLSLPQSAGSLANPDQACRFALGVPLQAVVEKQGFLPVPGYRGGVPMEVPLNNPTIEADVGRAVAGGAYVDSALQIVAALAARGHRGTWVSPGRPAGLPTGLVTELAGADSVAVATFPELNDLLPRASSTRPRRRSSRRAVLSKRVAILDAFPGAQRPETGTPGLLPS